MPRRDANQTDIDVGRRIRLQRTELGMNQTQLGAACGITFQQVQKYEKGANRVGASRLAQIAKALQVSPSYFFGEAEATNGGKKNGHGAQATLDALVEPGAYKMVRDYNTLKPAQRRAIHQLILSLAPEVGP
jgi:transcriptional regulator with XRE-family HTH domain